VPQSQFRMQIAYHKTGDIVTWKPGAPVETDLVVDLVERLRKRGVGLFTSEATVLKAVEEELTEVILDLKRKV